MSVFEVLQILLLIFDSIFVNFLFDKINILCISLFVLLLLCDSL